jgi:hypothetical protein
VAGRGYRDAQRALDLARIRHADLLEERVDPLAPVVGQRVLGQKADQQGWHLLQRRERENEQAEDLGGQRPLLRATGLLARREGLSVQAEALRLAFHRPPDGGCGAVGRELLRLEVVGAAWWTVGGQVQRRGAPKPHGVVGQRGVLAAGLESAFRDVDLEAAVDVPGRFLGEEHASWTVERGGQRRFLEDQQGVYALGRLRRRRQAGILLDVLATRLECALALAGVDLDGPPRTVTFRLPRASRRSKRGCSSAPTPTGATLSSRATPSPGTPASGS